MASKGKKKTTIAKINRESRLRERRLEKEARKAARKQAAASDHPDRPGDTWIGPDAESAPPLPGGPPS
jgi:hypothetical protein